MNALRAGLCALLAFAVLANGAADVWAASALEIGAAVLFLYWAVLAFRDPEAKVYWVPLAWPLAGFLAIGILQLLFHGTANGFYTRVELLRAAGALLIFFLAAQAFRTRTDLSRLAWFFMFLSFFVSLFGIAQYFTSNGKIYWFQSLAVAGGEFFGPYVNRNHFAGFVELTMPVGVALIAFRAVRRDLVPFATLLSIVPIAAIVLAGSRGGVIAAVFQIALLLLLARSRRASHRGQIVALAAIIIAALALISWLGTGTTLYRFSQLRVGDVSLDRRVSMARGGLRIFLDHPVKGSGLGTLVDVYPRYETVYDGRLVTHVHNDYVEALAETGILGGLCGAAFLWLLFREARRSFTAEQGHLSRGLHAGAIVAVSGLLLHSFVDFNLHIPANAALFLVQAYVATSPPLPSASQAVTPRRRP